MMTTDRYNLALKRIRDRVAAMRASGMPRGAANEVRGDLEFRLTIDHRLGEDFPRDRRESLASLHRDFRRDIKAAIGRHVRGEATPDEHAAAVNDRTRRLIADYALVLSPEELGDFVGGDPGSCGEAIDPRTMAYSRAR
jgi:hypothetical protein